jgi:hypothetical protein
MYLERNTTASGRVLNFDKGKIKTFSMYLHGAWSGFMRSIATHDSNEDINTT